MTTKSWERTIALLRAFNHTHTAECACPNPTGECADCDGLDGNGACAGRCEHAKAFQSLRRSDGAA